MLAATAGETLPRIESPTLISHGMRRWGGGLSVGLAVRFGQRLEVAGAPASAYTPSEPTTTEDPMETQTRVPAEVRGVVRGGRQRGNSRPVPVQMFCWSSAPVLNRFPAILIRNRGKPTGSNVCHAADFRLIAHRPRLRKGILEPHPSATSAGGTRTRLLSLRAKASSASDHSNGDARKTPIRLRLVRLLDTFFGTTFALT